MHGIVSLLDATHYRIVEDLWVELKQEFAVTGVYITPYPHFSYQVASHYNLEQLESTLQNFANRHAPFTITTTGLGIFTGTQPILYIPVVRDPHLTDFHKAVLEAISGTEEGVQTYYQPEYWMPHITIGFGDLDASKLAQIVGYLSQRTFNWQIPIDNIALIYDNGEKQELRNHFELKGTQTNKSTRQRRPVTHKTAEALQRVREQIFQNHGGKHFEDSTETIHEMREERSKELEEAHITQRTLDSFLQMHNELVQKHGGKPISDSTEIIHQMREERSKELGEL